MKTVSIIFYFFMIASAASALGILFIKNVFKGALLLLVSLLSIAAIYVLASAEFVAVTQIMIYAGGLLVVIIFGIMLTSKISGKPLIVKNGNVFAGLMVSSVVLVCMIRLFSVFSFNESTVIHGDAVTQTGLQLMSTYVLPFEVAGILLLIALLGAAVVTSFINKPNNR